MKFIKTPVKGMCDMLPADMRLREHVLGMIKETYGVCGFMQIETPVMEHIENLTSKQGGDNEKLIFKVMKRGAELQRALDKGDGELADNGLRYDLTCRWRYYATTRRSCRPRSRRCSLATSGARTTRRRGASASLPSATSTFWATTAAWRRSS